MVGQAAATGGSRRRASLYFAHAETVAPLACLLGLFGTPSISAATNEVVAAGPSAQACSARGLDIGKDVASAMEVLLALHGLHSLEPCAMHAVDSPGICSSHPSILMH